MAESCGPATKSKAQSAKPQAAPTKATTSAKARLPAQGARPSTARTVGKKSDKENRLPSTNERTKAGSKSSKAGAAYADTIEAAVHPDMSGEQAVEVAAAFMSPADIVELSSAAWKERLAAAVKLEGAVSNTDTIAAAEAIALFKVMEINSKKWKETNFQVSVHVRAYGCEWSCVTGCTGDGVPVYLATWIDSLLPSHQYTCHVQVMGKLFNVMAIVAQKTAEFPDRCVFIGLPGVVSKLGDAKIKLHAIECLHCFAEAWSLNSVSLLVCKSAQSATNPKVRCSFALVFSTMPLVFVAVYCMPVWTCRYSAHGDTLLLVGMQIKEASLNWMMECLSLFGLRIAVKPHAAFAKHCLAHVNPAVRGASVDYLGTL
jgi:hypothetical protein